jgi:hypothetical protein
MYELSLKQDLQQLFNVPEENVEGMNLASILRYYVKYDIRAHPILYANLTDIAQQRNVMAHEFLANVEIMGHLGGIEGVQLLHRDLIKWAWELELAFQQYQMLKETGMLYKDYGIKPTYPYPPDVGDNIIPEKTNKVTAIKKDSPPNTGSRRQRLRR